MQLGFVSLGKMGLNRQYLCRAAARGAAQPVRRSRRQDITV